MSRGTAMSIRNSRRSPPPPERRGHHLRVHDITRSAGGGDDDIHLRQELGKLVEGDGNPLELRGHLLGPDIGPVGDVDRAHPLADEVAGGQLRHLPGADQEDRFPFQIAEDLFRELHRRVTDGYGVAGDPRLRPNPLGHLKGVVGESVEEDPRRPVIDRHAVGFLHLPQDLRFAHDHGIEARRHAEQMADRLQIPVDVKASLQLGDTEVPLAIDKGLQPSDGPLPVRDAGEDLDPVAGGKVERLPDLRQVHQLRERLVCTFPAGELQPLPDIERGRLMVHADEDKLHRFTRIDGPTRRTASRRSAGWQGTQTPSATRGPPCGPATR